VPVKQKEEQNLNKGGSQQFTNLAPVVEKIRPSKPVASLAEKRNQKKEKPEHQEEEQKFFGGISQQIEKIQQISHDIGKNKEDRRTSRVRAFSKFREGPKSKFEKSENPLDVSEFKKRSPSP